jgi:CIC family chloride channel protein
LRYVETDRGYRFDIGRFSMSQSAFLLVAAFFVGIGAGYGTVLFRAMIYGETRLAFYEIAPWLHHWIGRFDVVPVVALGGILTVFITERFAKEAQGHGTPQVLEAVALRGGILHPRGILATTVAAATTLGFGGSAGREGPIIQIGATIGSFAGQLAKAPAPVVRSLVACGAAAGISATFNAPIGGVFFASEVILGNFAPRQFASIVISSVVAAIIGRSVFGDHPSFSAQAFHLVSPLELTLYVVLGVVAAGWAWAFVKVLYGLEDAFRRIRGTPYSRALVGFGAVGCLGIAFPQVFGVGYANVQAVLASHVPASHGFLLSVLKPVATSLTLASGGSGGVFAPSLYTGAMLGDAFGRIVHDLFPSWTASAAAYGLVGMAAVFAATSEAPITAIMIVFEMSNDYTIILPLMISVVIAALLGRRFIGGTIDSIALTRRGIDWDALRAPRPLTRVRVSMVEHPPQIVASPDDLLADVARKLSDTPEFVVPVCRDGRFLGLVLASDIAASLASNPLQTVSRCMRPFSRTLTRTDTLEQAALAMADPETPLLPVVDSVTGALLGIVTRRDVLNAYRDRVRT